VSGQIFKHLDPHAENPRHVALA